MRILPTVIPISLLLSSSAFGQVFFGPNPVAIDDADPPTMSRPGEVIPGTADVIVEPGVNLDGFDLRAAELNEIPNASFIGADLFRAALGDLPNADFSQANVQGASFSGNMRQANFQSASMDSALLGLRETNFSGADFTAADLSDAVLQHETSFDDARFERATFDRAVLSGRFFRAMFDGATFDQTNLSGSFVNADFSEATLARAMLNGDFQYANFNSVDMTQVSFEVQLRGVDQFLGADFSNANFSDRSYRALGFTNASFHRADLSNARFDNDVRFFDNDFRQADFDNVSFKGGSLPFADVRQVDFTGVSGPISLPGAKYDQFTTFPTEGLWASFDPNEQGMEYIPTTPGDTNLDDQITFDDFLLLSNNFGSQCQAETDLACWQLGDFDSDRVVGFSDFLLQADSFSSTTAANVPEPSTHSRFSWILLIQAFRGRKKRFRHA